VLCIILLCYRHYPYFVLSELNIFEILADFYVVPSNIWCTDTSDLRHFGRETLRHWCRSVWTFRHHFVHGNVRLINLFKIILLMTCVTCWYFLYTTSITFFVQGNQHTTELAEPLFYHGDAKANSFIEANTFVFLFFAESPIINA